MQRSLFRNARFKPSVLFLGAVIFCVGCAGPTLSSRIVQEESTWFVRLDSYGTAGAPSFHYDHPATLTEQEMVAILSRMLLEDRGGLMDSAQPPRPVFSTEEIGFLAPAIRESFLRATPREWISFFIAGPSAAGLVATSGGMFLDHSQLHLVVANHRTVLEKGSDELAAVRENPIHSVRGSGGALTFESPRFVLRRQANWSGGHRASASELVLDHQGFLSFLQRTGPLITRSSTGEGVSLIPSSVSASGVLSMPETDSQTVILQLQEEVKRLKQKVADQEVEINRLKRHR